MTRQELEKIILIETKTEKISDLVNRQISRYKLHGYTFKQIARAVVFLSQVRGIEFEEQYGIGLVLNVIEDSEKHFEKLKKERDARLESLKKKPDASNIILEPEKLQTRRKISFTRETEE